MITTEKASLAYPIGITIDVYRDDHQWDNYRAWFMRTDRQLRDLFVARVTLAHYETENGEEPEPAYSHDEWVTKSAALLEQFPGCIFIYASNEVAQ